MIEYALKFRPVLFQVSTRDGQDGLLHREEEGGTIETTRGFIMRTKSAMLAI